MTALYKIVDTLIELDSILEEIMEREDLSEEDKDRVAGEIFESYLETEGDLKEKLTNCLNYITELEGLTKLRKEEAKRLTQLAKSSESKADRLRSYITNHLIRMGISKIELPNNKISLRKKPDELEITCPIEDLPNRFKRVKVEADKSELRRALKETHLDYARLIPSEDYSLIIN